MPTTATADSYTSLRAKLRDAALISSASRMLAWDQETMMPPKAASARADQLSALASIAHEKLTSSELGDLIGACESDSELMADERASANIREIRRDYDHATKLPGELVAELAQCSSLGMDAWKQARADNDFKAFLPWLEKTFAPSRRKAECLGVPEGGVLYDALLDQYEPGMTTERTVEIFKPLRAFTVELLQKVADSGVTIDRSPVKKSFPFDKQRELVTALTAAIGYDYDAGRMDDATHPFCDGMAPGDTRITNRYHENDWLDPISSGLHEAGHAVYEQGLPKGEHFGEPLGDSISLGIHESQSRMWENLVGRSEPYWEWAIARAREIMGSELDSVTPEQAYKAANVVEPSYIRVEADEVTYNLHVMLRFDLERAMLHGDLNCADLPGVWNERIKSDFGLDVSDDRKGCLQDIHWSMGAVGYFSTYSFGNLYSAQFWEAMAGDLPNREELIRTGDFAPILAWLQKKIYDLGRQYRAEDLCQRITGKPLSHEALQRHLTHKVASVYGV